jgi:release factor glutamine methyltransferase
LISRPAPPAAPPSGPTRAEALATLRQRLTRAGVPDAAHDAEALLRHATGLSRESLWSDSHARLKPVEAERLEALALERSRRTPLQLLLGSVDFHRVTLAVEPGVFIPRPETETLVEVALRSLEGPGPRPGPGPGSGPGPSESRPARGTLLDLGTGTGAVAVALLAALPGWRGVAIDRSTRAVALARRNAQRAGVSERLDVWEGDFLGAGFAPAGAPFDLLVANPPYVPSGSIASLMPEVRDHDPREALDGGDDGLDALRGVARGLKRMLRPGGALALEIGEDQADACLESFAGLLEEARIAPDLAGRPRVLWGTYRG